jgi:hypothetical protein
MRLKETATRLERHRDLAERRCDEPRKARIAKPRGRAIRLGISGWESGT